MLDEIKFDTTATLELDELCAFYQRQGHPVPHAPQKLKRMLEETSCVVAARRDGELIGIARGVTDGLTGWLAECKLDPAYQGSACVTHTDGRIEDDTHGIAGEMARLAIEALRSCGAEEINTVAYGTEMDFCESIGFRKVRGAVAMALPADTPVKRPSAVTAVDAG